MVDGRGTDAAIPATSSISAFEPGHAGADLSTANDAAAGEEVASRALFDLQFECIADTAYYVMRETHFARMNRWLTGAQTLLSTGAVASLLAEGAWAVTVTAGLAGAVSGVILLVLDPAGAAREYRILRSRVMAITRAIVVDPTGPREVRMLASKRLEVAADAPPVLRALQAIAYNAAVDALYSREDAPSQRLAVTARQRWCAQWRGFWGVNFPVAKP